MSVVAIFSQKSSRHVLKKNISINLFTKMLPILVGIITLPILVKGLGVERAGILQIIWSLIGYSSFFDLGLGRALTQIISRKIALSETEQIPSIVTTTLVSIFLLGLIPVFCLIATKSVLIQWLNISSIYTKEVALSLLWLAGSIPAMLIITCQTGILQSYQKFDWISWLNLPALFGNFIAPIILLYYTHRLDHIVAVMVLCRFLMAGLFLIAISQCIQGLWQRFCFQFALIKPLFNFGKWVTISNIVGPLMVYLLDRLFLANLFSVKVASYYVIPYGILQKMSIVPWAIMGVMFPAFSGSFYLDKVKSAKYYSKSLLLTATLLLVPVIGVVYFSKLLLTLWMGSDFASNSYRLTQIIAIALYVYSINLVPSSLIQAAGQADFTAKLQLIEFPIFLCTMYFNIKTFGIMAAPTTLLGLFLLEGVILQWYALYLLQKPAVSAQKPIPSLVTSS